MPVDKDGRDAYSGLDLSIYVIKSPLKPVRQSLEMDQQSGALKTNLTRNVNI
jgi:hypothetical protein